MAMPLMTTGERLRDLLVEIGLEDIVYHQGEIGARCPMHEKRLGRRERVPRHWSVNTETGRHFCFSCAYGGSLVQLVMDTTGESMWEATRRIQHHSLHLLPLSPVEEAPPKPAVELTESYDSFSDPPDRALRRRGLTEASAALYGLRWDDGAWIIPIYNAVGGLMGWQAKGVDWVRNRPAGVRKGESLFGLRVADLNEPILVVESPLDAVYIHTLGAQAVAVYGSKVSPYQHSLLDLFDHIVWALDNDEAGRIGTARILESPWHGKKIQHVLNYQQTKAKDPGEMTPEEFHRALETVHWPRWI